MKTQEVMSSYCSSSDEQTSRLKEAIDTSVLKDDLYKDGIAKEKHDEQPKLPKSLRNQNYHRVKTNPFSLKVTPEFQKHVSQHLSKLLDKTIDDTEIFLKIKKQKKKPIDAGVKLLLSSKNFLNSAKNIEICGNSRKYSEINGGEIDYEARAKEVAVTSDWVLSKNEVKSWALSWRNNVEIVKLGSCKRKKKKKKKKKIGS